MTPLRFAATSSTLTALVALGIVAIFPQGCVAPGNPGATQSSASKDATAVTGAPAPKGPAVAKAAPKNAKKRRGAAAATAAIDTEPKAIAVLQSAATAREKDAACAQLKRFGTVSCIPAVAALLPDEQLSHSARYVLEAMTAPEAGEALLSALPKTSGATKAGIITSLGVRREQRAVPALTTALRDDNADVAIAAATALGAIGTPDALAAVQAGSKAAPTALQAAMTDAVLRCAYRQVADGQAARALPLFQALRTSTQSEAVQVAAFRGVLLSSGPKAVRLACDAIAGPSSSDQLVALQLVHELQAPGATAAFAQLLPRLAPPLQVALVGGLSQRNDPSAAAAIAALATSPATEVRVAVVTALGQIGDASNAVLLATTAARTTGAEQTAAREALVMLRRGPVADALLAELPTAKPPVQAEIARALAARTERSAVPKLQALAREDSASAHPAVLALARLAEQDTAGLAALVQLVVEAKDEPSRSFAAVAINSALQHIQYNHGRTDVTPLLKALTSASTEARVDLLPCCARINDPEVRRVLRAAVADTNPAIRDAATAALCATKDAELLPDLVNLACTAASQDVRSSAVSACVRLSKDDSVKLTDAQRLNAFRQILAASADADQKRQVVSALAGIPENEALQLLTLRLDDAAVRDDAAQAILKIAPLVSDSAAAAAALQKISTTTQDPALRRSAQQALAQSSSGFGFITNWRITGPFRQDGRDYSDLFEFIFKPESDDPQGVKWEPVTAPSAQRPWLVDVRKAMGKQEAVAYAQTWVHSDAALPVQLELGTDSSVKIWVNEKLVHTNPELRPLHAGADIISTTLKPGWNSLLMKLAQPGQAGEFCVRLTQPDGSSVPGLQISAAGPMKNQLASP